MQQGFRVAAGLLGAQKDQIAGGLEGNAALQVSRHGYVAGITCVLVVHHAGHAFQCGPHLLFSDHAVADPVGEVLAGDAQGGPVFHQPNIVDIRHLGTTHALVDPAHYITENALGVVVQFPLDVVFVQAPDAGQRDLQYLVDSAAGLAQQAGLYRHYIHAVVVAGVQCGCGRRRYPGTVGPAFGVAYLGLEHIRHAIRHGPHTFANLGVALQAAVQSHIDIPIFVGVYPGLALHGALGGYCAGLHAGMDLVTGSIQEARVDKDHPFPGPVDTFRQIKGGATFLIHDANLEGVWAQPKNLLDTGEHFNRETDLVGSVHFGLNDVHAAFSGVAQGALAPQVMERTGGGEQGVQYALGDLPVIGSKHRVVGHQVSDIAHKEQAASGQ